MRAVVTADIVNFTKFTNEQAEEVLNAIRTMFSEVSNARVNLDNNFSIKRGDSIQVELDNPEDALNVALLLKTALNRIGFNKAKKKPSPMVDARIAIGVGTIEAPRDDVNVSSGKAYEYSGRTLDAMKKSKRMLAIKTNNGEVDDELDTAFRLLEVIMAGWKITSAEVLYFTLMGQKEKQIEEALGISQPAVNQRKSTAGWSGIEALINRYTKLMNRREF